MKSSKTFKLGLNVSCRVPRKHILFKYIEESEFLDDEKNSDRRNIAAQMKKARTLASVRTVLCRECAGWARSGSHKSPKDQVCDRCLGSGHKSGDSQYRKQLQNGPPRKIEVRDSPGKGLAAHAGEVIPDGVAVMEVAGVIMTEQEAAKLDAEYARKGQHYSISIPQVWHGKGKRRRWVVDLAKMVISRTFFTLRVWSSNLTRTNAGARLQGNIFRLVNHTCGDHNTVLRLFEASSTLSKTLREKVLCRCTHSQRSALRRSSGSVWLRTLGRLRSQGWGLLRMLMVNLLRNLVARAQVMRARCSADAAGH